MNKAVDFRDSRLLVFQLCKGRKEVISDQCHSQIRLQNKIKGKQRLGTNRLRISQRFKSLFYGLMARSRSVFNGAFCNSSLKKKTVKEFKPKWWRGEMEPVNCILRADRNLGAAGFLERWLHFKEGRNFMHLSNDKQIVHEQHYKGLKYQNNVSRQHPTNQRQCPVILKSCVTINQLGGRKKWLIKYVNLSPQSNPAMAWLNLGKWLHFSGRQIDSAHHTYL